MEMWDKDTVCMSGLYDVGAIQWIETVVVGILQCYDPSKVDFSIWAKTASLLEKQQGHIWQLIFIERLIFLILSKIQLAGNPLLNVSDGVRAR